jgi:hypothetical protein
VHFRGNTGTEPIAARNGRTNLWLVLVLAGVALRS